MHATADAAWAVCARQRMTDVAAVPWTAGRAADALPPPARARSTRSLIEATGCQPLPLRSPAASTGESLSQERSSLRNTREYWWIAVSGAPHDYLPISYGTSVDSPSDWARLMVRTMSFALGRSAASSLTQAVMRPWILLGAVSGADKPEPNRTRLKIWAYCRSEL